jgi:hypothetical protein
MDLALQIYELIGKLVEVITYNWHPQRIYILGLGISTLIIFLIGVYARVSLWFLGRHSYGKFFLPSLVNWMWEIGKKIFSRKILKWVKIFLVDVLLERNFFSQSKIGWLMYALMRLGVIGHFATIFFVFVIAGTLLPWIASVQFLGLFDGLNDLCACMILGGALIALGRRYLLRTQSLRYFDVRCVLFVFFLGITGLLTKIFRVLAEEPPMPKLPLVSPTYSFLTSPMAELLLPLQLSWEILHIYLWGVHIAVAFFFIAYIPFSNTWHLIAHPIWLLVREEK